MSTIHGETAADVLRAMGEHSPGAIVFALDRGYRYIFFNARHAAVMQAIWGESIALGRSMLEVIRSDADREKARRHFDRALAGDVLTLIEAYGDEALQRSYWENHYAPVRDGRDEVIGVLVQVTDITVRRRNEELAQQQQAQLEEMVAARTAELEEKIALIQALSAPIIQVWDGVLVVPLVGGLDARQGSQITEDILAAIERQGTQEILLDITGLRHVDTSAAHHLLRTISAARLLGARCAIVGVSPEVARTMVALDVPLAEVDTYGTLRDGLRAAIHRMSRGLAEREGERARPGPRQR